MISISVNDYREATYFIGGIDAKGELLHGRNPYTMKFPIVPASVSTAPMLDGVYTRLNVERSKGGER